MEQKGFTVMSNNHFLPFMWVHGESEETYRHMVNVIYNSNIREICVEARPHKDFARDQWWIDLGYIIDEAEKLGMRIWILDDEHFPTGYAAGAALKAPPVSVPPKDQAERRQKAYLQCEKIGRSG